MIRLRSGAVVRSRLVSLGLTLTVLLALVALPIPADAHGDHPGVPDASGNYAYCLVDATHSTYGGPGTNVWVSCQYGPADTTVRTVHINAGFDGVGQAIYFDSDTCANGAGLSCDVNSGGLLRWSVDLSANNPPDSPFSTAYVYGCTISTVANPGFNQQCDVAFVSSIRAYPPYPPHWWVGGGDGNPVPYEQLFGQGGGWHGMDPSAFWAEPVNSATGSYSTSTTDARLPGIGLGFTFTRSYNSADPTVGPLGRGWTHPYNVFLDTTSSNLVVLHGEDGQQLVFLRRPDGSFYDGPGIRDTLVKTPTGYSLTRTDQLAYAFDDQGRLLTLRERNGQGLSFSYTAGALTGITDSVGRQIVLSYDAGGRLARLQLPDGRWVGYTYTNGLLTGVRDLRGNSTTYAYDPSDRLRTIVDQDGHTVVTNTYGADGRVIGQIDGRGHASSFGWEQASQTATFTDARGKTWTDVYAGGRLMRRIDPLGNTTRYTYDANWNVASITDPRGNTTAFTYDAAGNLLSRTDPTPLSYLTTYTYTARNDLSSVTDARGNTTTYGYYATGNLASTTQPGNVVTSFGRAPGTGLLTSITDPNNKTTSFGYDAAGNLTSITDPVGDRTTMGYDASGRMSTRVEPRGNAAGANPADYTWFFTYDDADHLLTQTDPLAHSTAFTYDPVGDLISRRDANNHTTSFTYDEDNNLVSVTAPDTTLTRYAYDDTNDLVSRTDAKSHVTTYAYDDAGRLSSVSDPLNRTRSFTYDAAGNLATTTLPQGSIAYAYDAVNRLVAITYSDAPTTPNVTFGYDPNGNRTSMSDGAGSVTYTYDALNRLSSATRGADSFGYGYDAAGNLTGRTYPDGTGFTYSYDGANRMTTLVTGGTTTSFGYDPASHLTSVTRPNGVGSTYTWDRAGRLTNVSNAKGTTVYSSFASTLDPVGNPTRIVTGTETMDLSYDAADRLTKVCYTSTCKGKTLSGIGYTYDAVGNRLTEVRYGKTSFTTTTSTYDAADQMTSRGTTSYTYDPNGNQASAGSRTFTYDLAGRLSSTRSGNTTESYAYDGDGNRLSLSTNGTVTTRYLWDANAALPQLGIERTGAGALLRRYAYGASVGQSPASMFTSGAAHYYTTDPLGSVANLTSSSGAKEWSYTWEPYGAKRSETKDLRTAPANPIGFTGQLLDPTTGDYDLRAREYDPVTGRFLSTDPLPGAKDRPYLSAYLYAEGRPSVLIDPSGLCFIGLIGSDCDNPVHTLLETAVKIGKVVYKGVKGCIKGAPYGLLGGAAVGGAFGAPEVGAAFGGAGTCLLGAAYELSKPPLSPDIPPVALAGVGGPPYVASTGTPEK